MLYVLALLLPIRAICCLPTPSGRQAPGQSTNTSTRATGENLANMAHGKQFWMFLTLALAFLPVLALFPMLLSGFLGLNRAQLELLKRTGLPRRRYVRRNELVLMLTVFQQICSEDSKAPHPHIYGSIIPPASVCSFWTHASNAIVFAFWPVKRDQSGSFTRPRRTSDWSIATDCSAFDYIVRGCRHACHTNLVGFYHPSAGRYYPRLSPTHS